MHRPTVIGTALAAPTAGELPGGRVVALSSINTGAIVLREAQLLEVEKRVAALDFESIPQADIVKIGLLEEQELSNTLDGFMARLNQANSGKTFDLFNQVKKGVDDAKLPEIMEKIKNPPAPSAWARFVGFFRGKSVSDLASDLYKEIANLITGRAKTLADLLAKMEGEIRKELANLSDELQVQHRLKQSYQTHFGEFTVAAAVGKVFYEKARLVVAEEEAKLAANPADTTQQARVLELQNKLALLESRALALEGVHTRLPADALVIQQIEQAGVSTLQETATTMNARFISIKQTLLTIHGAFQIQGVQMLADRSAKMDQQLTAVRGQLLKQVAGTAAAAPGKNRLAQAQQIELIIAQVREISDIVEAGRTESRQNMEEARRMFASSREELAKLASGN